MKKKTCARSGAPLDKYFGRVEIAQMVVQGEDLVDGVYADGEISASYNLTPDLTEQVSMLIRAFVERKISVVISQNKLSVKVVSRLDGGSSGISFLKQEETC